MFCVTAQDSQVEFKVMVNGIKGRIDADSCSSANVMDKEQFNKIVKASRQL